MLSVFHYSTSVSEICFALTGLGRWLYYTSQAFSLGYFVTPFQGCIFIYTIVSEHNVG